MHNTLTLVLRSASVVTLVAICSGSLSAQWHLDIEVTVDDPKAYTRPWTVTIKNEVMLDTELIEFICLENEKSTEHFR